MGSHGYDIMTHITSYLLVVAVVVQAVIGQLELPPKDPVDEVPEDDSVGDSVVEYELPDGMEPNDNGYGGQPELKCRMEEKVSYEDRVCDTNYNLDVVTEDDYQCIDLEDQYCEDVEVMVNDVVCKYSFKFECKKPKRGTGGYGMEKVCTKEPEEKC